MQKTFTRRVLVALALALVLVCAACVTAMAESVKYDYSAYASVAEMKYDANKPDLGGWYAVVPDGVPAGNVHLTNAETSAGLGEANTRLGTVMNEFYFIYNVPKDDQIKIKNFGEIVFDRRVSNGGGLLNCFGATYSITFVMDDGQEIVREYPWYTTSNGVPISASIATVVDSDIQKAIQALDGDPTLVQIKYRPYSADPDMYRLAESALYKPAVPDSDPDDGIDDSVPSVYGTVYYFLTRGMQFNESATIPENLSVEKDTWDGTEADAHDGKITGLDAAKTYKYAPVHSADADFITVTGVSAIENLVGGVYEVRGVEEGKSDSASVTVIVPKDVTATKNTIEKFGTDTKLLRDEGFVSGTWASLYVTPNLSSVKNGYYMYVASNYLPYCGSGVVGGSLTAPNATSAEYYRRNVAALTYVFTPEEQIDVDKMYFVSRQFATNYPWKDTTPVTEQKATYAIYFYVNGDTENPYIVEKPWTSTASIHQFTVNLSKDLDGYLTAIKFVTYYNIPDVAPDSNKGAYPLYNGYKTFDLAESSFEVPEVAADTVDTYKITGLNADNTYALSADLKSWTEYSNVNEIKGLDIGTYYIQEFSTLGVPSEILTVKINGAYTFESELYADGMTVKGFDPSLSYEYAPASVLSVGEWDWKDLGAGTTELTLTNGLYGFRIKAGNGYLASLVGYVYVYDMISDRGEGVIFEKADGTKAVYDTKNNGNKKTPFDIGYWSSSVYKYANNYASYNDRARIYADSFTLDTVQDKAFAQLLGTNVTFAMKPEQVVEISDFISTRFAFSATGYMGYTNVFEGNTSTEDFRARLRIYVLDSDVEYYDIIFPWTGTIDVQANLPEDAHGYVVGLQVWPFAYIPEGKVIQDSYKDINGVNNTDGLYWDTTNATLGRYLPCFVDFYSYSVRKAEIIENNFTFEGYLDGYRMMGLDADKTYTYSVDNKVWNTVSGVDTLYIEGDDKLYIKIIGENGNFDSQILTIDLPAKQPAATGLTYADGVISGFDTSVSYEYRAVNAMNEEWTVLEIGTTELAVKEGVWAIRIAADDNAVAGAAEYITVIGEKYGNIAWGRTNRESSGFLQGYWTTDDKTVYIDPFTDRLQYPDSTSYNNVRVAQHWAGDYESRMHFVYRYALENDEVFPVANLDNFSISIGFGGSSPWTSSILTACIRVYVEGGDVPYYDSFKNYTYWAMMSSGIADVIPAGAKGFVTAIEVYPLYEIPGDDHSRKSAASGYPVMRIESYDNDSSIAVDHAAYDKFRCDIFAAAAPVGLTAVKGDGYYSAYTITGLDPTKLYEYSYEDGAYVALEAGTTEFAANFPGDYRIRYAATETEEASSASSVIVPFVNPVFGDKTQFDYKTTNVNGTNVFFAGKWSTYPGQWEFSQVPVTTYIGPAQKLNGVVYQYEFYERDYFVIDEHPYLSVDFNNENIKMGLSNNYSHGGTFAVDVYVVGESDPYTITSPWIGYSKYTYTANKILVNLLDEYPELSGKSVRAFALRPYYDLDKAPGEFNEGGYIYFRLHYVGFFDTPYNTDAIALVTNEAVNTLTGIRAESKVVYGIGATPKASDFAVYEVYSDGQEYEITNFDIVVPEDFATASGTYDVTINGRLGTTCTVETAAGLESISVKTAPAKTEYFDGDAIDLTGLELLAVLANGEEFTITTGYKLTVDTVTLDMTSVTVVFGGMEVSFDITVVPVEVVSLAMNTWPDKHKNGGYNEGDPVDLTGLTIKATYNNGVVEVLGLDKINAVYHAPVMTRGTLLSISYGGKTISGFILTVNSKAISEISVATLPNKTAYTIGEAVDFAGFSVNVLYEDGTTAVVSEGFVSTTEFTEAGTVTVEVLYEGFTVTFEVEVVVIETAFIMEFPVKTEYVVGEELDTEGLTLYVLYSNGDEALLTEGFELIYDEFTAEGEYEIIVKYFDFEEPFVVTVVAEEEPEPVVVESITVTAPTKTEYTVGDTLDLAGMVVTANYSDATTADVTALATVDTTTLATAGNVTVTVTYEGFTATFVVTVAEKVVVESITVTAPTKTEYTVGDTLDLAGMVVTANYSDATTADVTALATVDTTTLATAGNVTVTVTYESFTATFVVTVAEKVVVESITVTAPTKTEYTVGDTLDLAGMVVTANYSDATTADVTALATVDTTTLATAGNVTVTVTYEGFTATFVVTVAEKVVEPEEPANIAEGTIGTVNWVITADGTLTVSGAGEVPNYTRSATAPWYAYAKQIKKIVVADGITKLGDYCFYNLAKATAIEIAPTVSRLGIQFIRQTAITEVTLTGDATIVANAFGRADKLTTLILSENVKSLQGNIFYQETVTIKAPENSFAHKYAELFATKYATSAAKVSYESDGTVAKLPIVRFAAAGDNAFFAIYENAKGAWLLEVSGSGVMKNFPYVSPKNIAKGYTFSPMYYIADQEALIGGVEPETKISSITVKEGITTVGNYIFYKCTKATSLTLPEGITSIGQGAFRLCQRIAKITLPEAVTKIEKNAFLSCGKLSEIYIPEGVTIVGEGIFEKCTLDSLTVKTKSATAIEVISAEYPTVTIVTEF